MIFVGSVAQMRGLSEDAVRATEARLLFGHGAVDAGLADAVLSLQDVHAEFAARLAGPAVLLPSPVAATLRPPPSSTSSSTAPTMNSNDLIDLPPVTAPPPSAAHPAAPAAAAAYRSEAHAIAELCLNAGAPERTAEFLGAGMTQDQVRRVLLDARANQPEISSRITADAGTSAVAAPESSPRMAAVKKLISRS